MATVEAPKRYRVTAPCLTAKTMALSGMMATHRHGYMAVTLYAGGFMPIDAPPEQIADYLARDLIEEFEEAPADA